MYILPSKRETSLTPVIEAWASGTPVIACAEAPIAAHIEDGLNGILVPGDSTEKLALAARTILADEALRQRLIAQGYAVYIKSYTSEAVARQWVELYKKLAD
jgi:glycosyltransferase involved in cell wall biosynthesis